MATKKEIIREIVSLGGEVEDESVKVPVLKTQLKKLQEAAAKKDKTEKPKSKLGFLGGVAISAIKEKVIGNKKFNNVILIDGVGYLLSDKDLKAQVKAKL